jgi:hypothetical protein
LIAGDITENPDLASGEVQLVIPVSGAITNNDDIASGTVSLIYPVFGNIKESPDQVDASIGITIQLFGAIKEGRDKVRGNISGPLGPRPSGADGDANWAPQFFYKRDWEIEPEPEYVEPEIELDPYFIPAAPPMDPAVARIIEMMRQGPQIVDTDEDDLAAILMEM